jgi:POT family proton-dependent oligopeptide transporter
MLFFAEMWERFSYYGMRALLIFYLTKHWLFDDGKSNLIYGAYTSLVYITPVLGGYLADRYLGQRKAVLFGGSCLRRARFQGVRGRRLARPATDDQRVLAMPAPIIVGSGFRANDLGMVGQLYCLTDVRCRLHDLLHGHQRGRAMGTILVGYLGQRVGWIVISASPGSACCRPRRLRAGQEGPARAGEPPERWRSGRKCCSTPPALPRSG